LKFDFFQWHDFCVGFNEALSTKGLG
jgi:hypothetical protein